MQKPKEIGDISDLGQRYLDGELEQDVVPDDITASSPEAIPKLSTVDPSQAAEWKRLALDSLHRGEVVFGLLAAGASSRMDTQQLPPRAAELLKKSGVGSEPLSKALVPVVENGGRIYTFVDLFYSNVQRFTEAVSAPKSSLLFVSEKNEREVRDHLQRKFASDSDLLKGVHEIVQPLEPQIIASLDEVKRRKSNFANEQDWAQACEVSRRFAGHSLNIPKPAGHGEFLHQLVGSGMASQLISEGVRYITVRNIDNIPAVLDDAWLLLFGHAIENELNLLVEVSQRMPAQKGGALIQQKGRWRLAEDPAFEGSSHQAAESFYINNAAALIRIDYLEPLYETTQDELLSAWKDGDYQRLRTIADQGRRRFPTILEAKPVVLDEAVVGAITPETNMWESTSVAPSKVNVGAFAVFSEADEGRNVEEAEESEQQRRSNRVRFSPVKKWDDYEDRTKQTIIHHVAQRVLHGTLFHPEAP